MTFPTERSTEGTPEYILLNKCYIHHATPITQTLSGSLLNSFMEPHLLYNSPLSASPVTVVFTVAEINSPFLPLSHPFAVNQHGQLDPGSLKLGFCQVIIFSLMEIYCPFDRIHVIETLPGSPVMEREACLHSQGNLPGAEVLGLMQ